MAQPVDFADTPSNYNEKKNSDENHIQYMGFKFSEEAWEDECQKAYNSQSEIPQRLYKPPILEEEVIEVPEVEIKEQTVQKIEYIPKHEYFLQNEIYENECTLAVPKLEYKINPITKERIEKVHRFLEVPQISYVDKIVDIERLVTKSSKHTVPAIKTVTKPIHREVPVYTEKIVEIPKILYRQVPNVRFVEVPKTVENIVYKNVEVPQKVVRIFPVEKPMHVKETKITEIPVKVPVPRFHQRIKYVPQVIPRYRFVKVEKRIPRPVYIYQPENQYKEVEVPVYVNKTVYVPVPKIHETVLQDVIEEEAPREVKVYKPQVIKQYVKKLTVKPEMEATEPLVFTEDGLTPYSTFAGDLYESDPHPNWNC